MALKVVEGSGSVCIKVQRVECVFIRGPAAPYVTAAETGLGGSEEGGDGLQSAEEVWL